MLKKSISLLVSVSMILALIPTVTATHQPNTFGVVYADFDAEAEQEIYINEPIQITEPVSFDIQMEQPKIVKEVTEGDVSMFAVTADKTADWNSIMNNRFGDSYLAPYRKKAGQNVSGATNRLCITETDLSLPGKNGLDVNIRRKHDNQSADNVYSLYRAPGNTIYNYRYVRAFTDTATNATVYIGFYTEDDFHRYMSDGITIFSYPTVTYHIQDRGIYCYYAEDIYSNRTANGITLVPDNTIPRFYEDMEYPESTFNDILNYSILTNRNYLPAEWELELPEASLYAYESNITTLSNHKEYQYCSLGAFRDMDGTVHMLEGDQIVRKYEDRTAELSFSVKAENGFLDFSGFITERELDDTGIMYNTTITDRRTGYTYYMYNIGLSPEKRLTHQKMITVAVKDRFGNMIQYRYNDENFSVITQIVDTYGREINFEKFNSENSWGMRVSYEDENGEEQILTYETQTLSPDTLDNDSEIKGKPVIEFKVTNAENETTIYYSRETEFLTFDTGSQIQTMYGSMPHADGMPTGISYKSNIEKIVYPTGAETVYNYDYLYFTNKSMSTARGLYAVSESYDISDTDEKINHKTYTFENTSSLTTKTETDVTRDSTTVSEYEINGHIKNEESRKERVYEENVYKYNDDNQLIKLTSYNCGTTTIKEYTYVNRYPDVLSSVITDSKDKITYTYHNVASKMTGIPEKVNYYKYKPSTKSYVLDYSVNTILDSENRAIEYEQVIKDNIIKSQRKYIRDEFGRLTSVIDWVGDTNSDGVLDENDETITLNSTYALNENGSIGITDTASGVKDADGENIGAISTEYLYTVTGLPYRQTLPDGQVTEIEYDGIGRAVQYTYPNNSTEEISYDISERTTIYTDRAGKRVKIEYDGLGKPLRKYFFDTEWILAEENSYDTCERLSEKKVYTDSDKYTKESFEYDILNRITKRTFYNGEAVLYTENYSYYHRGSYYTVTKTTVATDGTATATEVDKYDAFNNLIEKNLTSGNTTITSSNTYDYKDRLISETDGKGNTTAYEYDEKDNITLITYADGTSEGFTYDMAGRNLTSTDRNGVETTNTYDVLGRKIKTEINTNGTDTSLIKMYYDNNSNLVRENVKTNERGDNSAEVFKTTEHIYDNMNNLLGTKTGRNAVQYWYDEAGRMSAMQTGITQIDKNADVPQNGSVTRYTYNNSGYLLTETDALNQTESFTYDYVGNVKTSTDRNGAVTTNTYGPYGLLSTNITNGTDTEEYTYTYNSLGKLKETKLYKNGVLKDIITSEYDGFGRKVSETSNGYTNTYEYDNNSSLTNYKLKDGSTVKENINYVYNNMNRLTEANINDTIISYSYSNTGNLLTKQSGDHSTEIEYNSFGEPLSYVNKYGETILNSYNYTYSADGNRLSDRDTANNISKVYEYNESGMLTKESISGAIEKDSTYIYDSNGNRIAEDTEYEQDLFSEENESFSYNLQNQLVGYTKGDTTVSYEYGANGLRKSKTVNGVTTGYIWNGTNLVAETDGEEITNIYSYGADGLTLRTTGADKIYYLKNAHGDVTAMANSSGTITAEYVYDSFGNTLTATNDTNPFLYCGEYTDSESNLVYLRNRYYNPTLGRFITEDPAKDGLNWYVYCSNNPVMFVDPSGYIGEEEMEMYENGEMSPGAYSYLMVCTYYYYLSDTDEGRNAWSASAQAFRDSGYTDTGNDYWNWTIEQMPSRPSGDITEEEHFFRNNLNIQFEWDDFEKLNERLPDNLKWRELPWYQSIFHKISLDTAWQGNNRKYVSSCEHFEVVYTKENYLVDASFSDEYMGTYNYYGPTQVDNHKRYDVDPYLDYGNVQ